MLLTLSWDGWIEAPLGRLADWEGNNDETKNGTDPHT